MRLTSRGDYAVRLLVELAKNQGSVMSLMEASKKQEIPFYYMQILVSELKKAELVKSVRGRGGGYALAKSPEEISLYEVFAAVQEPINSILEGLKKGETNEAKNLYGVFSTIDNVANNILNEVKLKDLL